MTIKTEQRTTELEPPYIERYYDSHIEEIEGVELSQADIHSLVIHYLLEVLKWLYHDQAVGVISEINLYHTSVKEEMPRSPDLMAIDGYTPGKHPTRSYTITLPKYPAPRMVIEIASEKTWEIDFNQKFKVYEAVGVQEYFIFDPNEAHHWNEERQQEAGGTGRLIGWRLAQDKKFGQIPLDNNRLWSFQADSWLAVENDYLRLYDLQNRRRLTEAEYNAQQREYERQQKEQERQQKEYEREQKELERQQKEYEREQKEYERQQKELERDRADRLQSQLEIERQQKEKLAAKLRELNINPDDF